MKRARARRDRQARLGDGSDARPGAEGDSGARRDEMHRRDYRRSMRHVGIVADSDHVRSTPERNSAARRQAIAPRWDQENRRRSVLTSFTATTIDALPKSSKPKGEA
jgi:hypothetical protein